jgi:toxin ParE1/3/4
LKKWRVTDRAKSDIAEIRRFTAERWGLRQARDYLNNLHKKIKIIASEPGIGVDRSQSLDFGHEIRSVLCESHVIYYVVMENYIVVVAVLHQRMVPEKHLADRFQE